MENLKKIAWNKISLKVPSIWEIDSLDFNHLIIGEGGISKLEIKWTDSPNKFTLEKYLKKFIAQSKRLLCIKIYEQPAPNFSFPHKNNFKSFYFTWKSATDNGNGTLLFCSFCKKLTMIRFFSDSQITSGSFKGDILSSFKDHPNPLYDDGNEIFWEIFGMKFSTPDFFKLSDYSFKPGCYIIKFKQNKTMFTIFSWGPALFLLKNASLVEFAFTRVPNLKGFAKTGESNLGTYFEWSYNHGLFKNAQLLPLLNRYSFHSLFRICHSTKKNRIFGILVDSPQKENNYNIIKRSIISDIQEKNQ